MLGKLRNGESLSAKDEQTLSALYATGHEARAMMDKYVGEMQDKDITDYIKEGVGAFKDTLDKLEKATLQENRLTFAEQTTGAGMRSTEKSKPEEEKQPPSDTPTPFPVPRPQPRQEQGKEEGGITPTQAEKLCVEYFSAYKGRSFACVGETTARGRKAYNVRGYDEKGVMIFAEIDKKDGTLVRFDYHETCMDKKFDMDGGKRIAEQFLEKLGYEDMETVRVRENGAEIDFTFAYTKEGVAYYPDEIKVKVCLSRGVVTAMDAGKYLARHHERGGAEVRLTMSQAKDRLHKNLSVQTARLAVVDTARGERSAYEFLCEFEGERYFVYLDAENGNEIAIVNVRNVG
jgi:germination protein YpeB